MGHWGCGIWDSDQAQDFKLDVEAEMAKGKSLHELSWGDEDECLALAELQAGTGKINEFLKKRALEIIDREVEEIDSGTSPWNEPEERETVIFELQGHICDALETGLQVEKEVFNRLLKGEASDKVMKELYEQINESWEADYVDLAKLQIKGGKIHKQLKEKVISILDKWIERYKHNPYVYDMREEYVNLKKEINAISAFNVYE